MKVFRKTIVLMTAALLALGGCAETVNDPIISLSDVTIEQQDAALHSYAEAFIAASTAESGKKSSVSVEELVEAATAETLPLANVLIDTCNNLTEADDMEDFAFLVGLRDATSLDNSRPKLGALDEILAVRHFCPHNNEKLQELLELLK